MVQAIVSMDKEIYGVCHAILRLVNSRLEYMKGHNGNIRNEGIHRLTAILCVYKPNAISFIVCFLYYHLHRLLNGLKDGRKMTAMQWALLKDIFYFHLNFTIEQKLRYQTSMFDKNNNCSSNGNWQFEWDNLKKQFYRPSILEIIKQACTKLNISHKFERYSEKCKQMLQAKSIRKFSKSFISHKLRNQIAHELKFLLLIVSLSAEILIHLHLKFNTSIWSTINCLQNMGIEMNKFWKCDFFEFSDFYIV